jgi:hypothetical protein
MAEVDRNYLKKLKTTMEHSFNIARDNRNTRMELTQINHNRKKKKAKYEEGDLVLSDHPKIKRGLSRGISHKYYGPFVIQKIEEIQVDYVIKRLGIKNGKRYKIHQQRLKFYHASQQKRDSLEKVEEDDESSNDEQPAKSKRKYIKNMNNPRWKNNQIQNVTCETASEKESESDFDENVCKESQVENEDDNDNSLNNLFNNNHQESILETPEPILVTSKKRGSPKKVKVPKDEIIITAGNKSITDTNNISPTPKTSGNYKLRKRTKQINYKTLRNINEIKSNGVELDNDYD